MKKPNAQFDGLRDGRRNLLKAAAGFGGALVMGVTPFRALAQATAPVAPDRNFLFVYMSGGWDQLLGLDPRDPVAFPVEKIAETRIMPGYDLITDPAIPIRMPITPVGSNITFGPAIGRLADHYDQMAVVRGINMTTLAHEVGYRYFLTGRSPNGSAARGSSTATEIVGQMRPSVPIPSLALGVESYNDRYGGFANALKVNRTSDLLLTLSPAVTALDSEIEKQLVDFSGRPVTCESQLYDSRGLVTGYEDSREQMRAVTTQGLNRAFQFDLPENLPTRMAYKLPATGPYDQPSGRAAMAGTAFKRSISQCVSITLQTGFDTHFGPQNLQASRQLAAWNALADLVSDLKATDHPAGGNFMQHTTILVFSEFSRTPLINSTGGRDHHLCGSCLLMGAGIRKNFVFGKSGDIGMAPGLFDLKTGLPDPAGRNVYPDEIIATVLASAKLDYSITRTEPLKPLLAS